MLLLRALKQGFVHWLQEEFLASYLWQVCINGGAGFASILFCKADLDLQQFSKSLQLAKLFSAIMLDRKGEGINLKI